MSTPPHGTCKTARSPAAARCARGCWLASAAQPVCAPLPRTARPGCVASASMTRVAVQCCGRRPSTGPTRRPSPGGRRTPCCPSASPPQPQQQRQHRTAHPQRHTGGMRAPPRHHPGTILTRQVSPTTHSRRAAPALPRPPRNEQGQAPQHRPHTQPWRACALVWCVPTHHPPPRGAASAPERRPHETRRWCGVVPPRVACATHSNCNAALVRPAPAARVCLCMRAVGGGSSSNRDCACVRATGRGGETRVGRVNTHTPRASGTRHQLH